ncbi:unnamed protein product [Trichogramma brassicae]|uniref:Uncharacterized protein n=1 Tax=Trichogramma brassicae TaxID=86971 RepID=A0A6H5J193_9HYME|nr:unnamed protein product [Trichogramma brassicae]
MSGRNRNRAAVPPGSDPAPVPEPAHRRRAAAARQVPIEQELENAIEVAPRAAAARRPRVAVRRPAADVRRPRAAAPAPRVRRPRAAVPRPAAIQPALEDELADAPERCRRAAVGRRPRVAAQRPVQLPPDPEGEDAAAPVALNEIANAPAAPVRRARGGAVARRPRGAAPRHAAARLAPENEFADVPVAQERRPRAAVPRPAAGPVQRPRGAAPRPADVQPAPEIEIAAAPVRRPRAAAPRPAAVPIRRPRVAAPAAVLARRLRAPPSRPVTAPPVPEIEDEAAAGFPARDDPEAARFFGDWRQRADAMDHEYGSDEEQSDFDEFAEQDLEIEENDDDEEIQEVADEVRSVLDNSLSNNPDRVNYSNMKNSFDRQAHSTSLRDNADAIQSTPIHSTSAKQFDQDSSSFSLRHTHQGQLIISSANRSQLIDCDQVKTPSRPQIKTNNVYYRPGGILLSSTQLSRLFWSFSIARAHDRRK